jgi:hypothetical protein
MAQRKLTDAQIAEAVRLHADGVSFRTLATFYGCTPSLVHRHVQRVNAERKPVTTEPPSGAANGTSLKRHRETEFPFDVPGFEPEGDIATVEVVVMPVPDRPPDRAPGQARTSSMHPLEWAEHRLKCARQDIAHLRTVNLPGRLGAAEERERLYADFIERWADAYAGLSFGRPRTLVKVGEQTLRDGPPPALWDNPYDKGPRGFDVVGS